MKKHTTYTITFLFLGMLLVTASCKKDLGNYNYTAINEISFPGLDTVKGYKTDLGTTLDIIPGLKATIDQNMSGNYSYEWKLLSKGGLEEQPLSTEKDLHKLINFLPGSYTISYSVKDNATGVMWLTKFPFTVTTPYYEGWLVLNKVNGASRLDFLSYKDNSFIHTTDLIGKLHVDLPATGAPRQVLFSNYSGSAYWKGIELLTANGTYRLDPENFSYTPEGYITKSILGNVPPDFKAEKIIFCKTELTGNDNLFMYAGGNIYKQAYGLFSAVYLNYDEVTGQPFHVSPHVVYSNGFGATLLMYNEDDKNFVQVQRWSITFYSVGAARLIPEMKFPTGKDLLYMTDNDVVKAEGTNYGYAIMKDPGISKFYLLRFSFGGFFGTTLQPVDYNQEITATDFALAEHYAISPNLGYLFYNVGGKLYEYDMFLKTTKLMLDKGNAKISLLVFDTNKKPDNWKNSLMVGSYDPAGTAGTNGTLVQYTVPPVNGNLIEQNKWTGMGEVVSVSYRYR